MIFYCRGNWWSDLYWPCYNEENQHSYHGNSPPSPGESGHNDDHGQSAGTGLQCGGQAGGGPVDYDTGLQRPGSRPAQSPGDFWPGSKWFTGNLYEQFTMSWIANFYRYISLN